jgi:AcrR family transcriptional regulator
MHRDNVIHHKKDRPIFDYRLFGDIYPLPMLHGKNETGERILVEATLLFAQRGYAGARMQELAQILNMTTSSLYNYYPSKEKLWVAVLEHTERLFLLYINLMDAELQKATCTRDVVNIFFEEAKKLRNPFTCYAFTLVKTEQMYSELARNIWHRSFYSYAVDFAEKWYRRCIERGWSEPFDCHIAAWVSLQIVLDVIKLETKRLMGCQVPDPPKELIASLEKFLLKALGCEPDPDETPGVDFSNLPQGSFVPGQIETR